MPAIALPGVICRSLPEPECPISFYFFTLTLQ
jgi:hypothetical protein